MRNLVIGSDGFVGNPLCAHLEACGDPGADLLSAA